MGDRVAVTVDDAGLLVALGPLVGGSPGGLGARDLLDPLVLAYAALLLAGSFARGIADIAPSADPRERFALSCLAAACLLLGAAAFFLRVRRRAPGQGGDGDAFARRLARFGVGCWAASYAAVPLVVSAPSVEGLPPYGSTKVMAVVLFALGAAGVAMAAVAARVIGLSPVRGDGIPGVASHVFRTALPRQPLPPRRPPLPSRPARRVSGRPPGTRPRRRTTGSPSCSSTATGSPTCREARLALLFTDGCSLGRAADELGISKGTAQGYIKAVCRKTGVRRMGDLVDILARAEG